jgi:hypothetical protein
VVNCQSSAALFYALQITMFFIGDKAEGYAPEGRYDPIPEQ